MLPRKTVEFKSKVLPTGYKGFEESRRYICVNCDEMELKFHPSMLFFMYNLTMVDGHLRMSHGATNHNVSDGQIINENCNNLSGKPIKDHNSKVGARPEDVNHNFQCLMYHRPVSEQFAIASGEILR